MEYIGIGRHFEGNAVLPKATYIFMAHGKLPIKSCVILPFSELSKLPVKERCRLGPLHLSVLLVSVPKRSVQPAAERLKVMTKALPSLGSRRAW